MKIGKYIINILLFPFSILYAIIMFIRNRLFDWNIITSRSFEIPVISVGNITIGGTGKTPVVEYIISLLINNYKVVYISRGYKRKSKGFVRATPGSGINEIGDEAVQIKNKFPDIEVIVDEKRVNAIKEICSGSNKYYPDVIVLDDAFQHRFVKPGLSVLLFDYYRPANKDWLIPSGSLREMLFEKKRADILVVTKCPRDTGESEMQKIKKSLITKKTKELYFSGLEYKPLIPVFNNRSNNIYDGISDINNFSILLITGIVNTKPLEKYLKNYKILLKHLKYPDHYNFNIKDYKLFNKLFKEIDKINKIIITTEKDAGRMTTSAYTEEIRDLPIYYIPIEIVFHQNKEGFDNKIINYVGTNIRSS